MWQLLFWGSIALILYTYFGYPFVLYLIGRLRPRKPHVVSGERPSVCLLVSAFNEDAVIREKIENSLALNYPSDRLQILIASDGSEDNTVNIAREYVEHGVRLHHHTRRRGKSAVLNQVVPTLDQDIVVFTDANAMLGFGCQEPTAVVGQPVFGEHLQGLEQFLSGHVFVGVHCASGTT